MIFYTGLHQPHHARHFDKAFISVNRIRNRKSAFVANDWIMDSGAFSEVSRHGGYRHDVEEYADQVRRWHGNGNMERAVSQDWMCEPHIVARTGMSVEKHQQLTVERYDALLDLGLPAEIMPVIQGYTPDEYLRHVELYGERLSAGMWVGVGSVCKRNSDPGAIRYILGLIRDATPDLRLHGFGLKQTALKDNRIRKLLYSADSMAWSFAARREGRDANSYHEALRFRDGIVGMSREFVPSCSDLFYERAAIIS